KCRSDDMKKVASNREQELHREAGVAMASSDQFDERQSLLLGPEIDVELFELIKDYDQTPAGPVSEAVKIGNGGFVRAGSDSAVFPAFLDERLDRVVIRSAIGNGISGCFQRGHYGRSNQ